ncbi:S-norcoclaurine synthase 2-like [Neltuma alba]|uniref:S-norcoclaurine synthase 2-like n=1 Tax=Neltuma alba TaxID=207710 RepID=UPI0010A2ADD2|nr:S-norcoclaurine synthase 2-like [Prosopis alba]
MAGSVEHELDLGLPASEAWYLFRMACRLASEAWFLFGTLMPDVFLKVELVEGDGGTGSVVKITFGFEGPAGYKEKFTKIDNDRRIKEVEIVEGGYLELGFSAFRVRLEVIEKGKNSSSVKSTMEYEFNEEDAPVASLINSQVLAEIALIAKTHLNKNKPPAT